MNKLHAAVEIAATENLPLLESLLSKLLIISLFPVSSIERGSSNADKDHTVTSLELLVTNVYLSTQQHPLVLLAVISYFKICFDFKSLSVKPTDEHSNMCESDGDMLIRSGAPYFFFSYHVSIIFMFWDI